MDGRRFDEIARLVATRTTRRGVLRGVAVGVVGSIVGRARSTDAAGRTAGVIATFELNGDRFRVWAANPTAIQQLRKLQRDQPTENVPFPTGPIKRGAGLRRHNAPWNWHFDPTRVRLTEVAIEVCDAEPAFVEDHIGYFVNVVGRYCPWGARFVSLEPFRL